MKVLENINTDKEIIRLEYGRKVSPGFIEAMSSSDFKSQLGDLDPQELADIVYEKYKQQFKLFNYDRNNWRA